VTKAESTDLIIASIPLAAVYYECGGVEQVKNAREIRSIVKMKGVLLNHSRGWLVLDESRIEDPFHTPGDVREFIKGNMVFHETEAKGIKIFSWDARRISRVIEPY